MDDVMEIDVKPKSSLKRKREKQNVVALTPEERDSRLKSLNEELESLFRYFNEVLSVDIGLSSDLSRVLAGNNTDAMIVLLLVEKRCSYSKLVAEIYEKLRIIDNGVTIASVKKSVMYVGKRIAYGVPNDEADVLEDETESCLWCWEPLNKKLLPSSVRGALQTRRTCREKIHERITAISDVIFSLQKPEDLTCKNDVTKAVEKLNKVLAEADIRSFVECLNQKNDSDWTEKEAKKKETTIIKELEKSKREEEKEKKKMDRELQKEKLQSEKEKKRLQQEAERDEKRREKEESEMRKQQKRKQEEADREQRRREKEEAELKKQLSIQKQASLMERFLKKSKITSTLQSDESPKAVPSNQSQSEIVLKPATSKMDSVLQCQDEINVDEIRKSHMSLWRCLGHSIRSNHKHWGLRQKPKTTLFKELKLTSNDGAVCDDDLLKDNIVDGWVEMSTDDKSCQANTSVSPGTSKYLPRKQLLQFDKSHRPAFYGLWPKKSCIIGPRHPIKKDPDLDYDIDSDEEWEEEDPGESLSDSEKEEEENLDDGSLKVDGDDEESEDDFFVPDGYLSENEGVDTDRSQSNLAVDATNSSLGCKAEVLSEECSAWMRQLKYLNNLTEHALKKNEPLMIVNMMHDKASLLSAKDLTGSLKVEQMSFQALSIRAFSVGLSIEVPSETNLQEENQEACTSNTKNSIAATGVSSTILDSDLPKIVSIIQSCPQGIDKVVESLQQNFPGISKAHLKNKVREISDYNFTDNRWKVKKEILAKLGLSSSPEKSGGRTQSIAAFFSKRCLPPSGQVVNPCESSPQSMKHASSSQKLQLQEQSENV